MRGEWWVAMEGGGGLRDPRPRLRWTPGLHDRFLDAVTRLGGPESNSQISTEGNGIEGIDTVSLEKPSAENFDGYQNWHAASASTNSSGKTNDQGEIPIAEALKCRIEVQKILEGQLEVQKKLQIRIDAQRNYLQAILEKAENSLSANFNHPGSLESTKAQLSDFKLALSSFMQDIKGNEGNGNANARSAPLNGVDGTVCEPSNMGGRQEIDDIKIKLEGPWMGLELNTRSSYKFIGMDGSICEAKPLANI